jgi:hypothetical protein
VIETRRFPPLLAAAALVILIHQAADLTTLLPAADLATPAGRVSQLLVAQARTPAILIADVLLIWAVLASGFSGAVRVVAVLQLSFGVLLLLLLPWFLLDAAKLARGFAGPGSLAFRVFAARTLLVLFIAGIGSLVASRALFLAVREVAAVRK